MTSIAVIDDNQRHICCDRNSFGKAVGWLMLNYVLRKDTNQQQLLWCGVIQEAGILDSQNRNY